MILFIEIFAILERSCFSESHHCLWFIKWNERNEKNIKKFTFAEITLFRICRVQLVLQNIYKKINLISMFLHTQSHTHLYKYIHAYIHSHTHTHTRAHTHTRTHTHLHTYIYIYMYVLYMLINIYIYICIYIYIHMCVCVNVLYMLIFILLLSLIQILLYIRLFNCWSSFNLCQFNSTVYLSINLSKYIKTMKLNYFIYNQFCNFLGPVKLNKETYRKN